VKRWQKTAPLGLFSAPFPPHPTRASGRFNLFLGSSAPSAQRVSTCDSGRRTCFHFTMGGARIYISPYISARLSAVLASPRSRTSLIATRLEITHSRIVAHVFDIHSHSPSPPPPFLQRDLFWLHELCPQNGLLSIYPAHHGSRYI
jgi:hypothetical protein